jgi:hypothetical protein
VIISYTTHGLIKGIPVMIKKSGMMGTIDTVQRDGSIVVRIPSRMAFTRDHCYLVHCDRKDITPFDSPVDVG